MSSQPKPQTVASEVIPHPRFRGDWLLKPTWGARCGLWYRQRQFGVSHANGWHGKLNAPRFGCTTKTGRWPKPGCREGG
jgi:hypothetical protein